MAHIWYKWSALVMIAALVGCSTQTYVSQENMDKFEQLKVNKFLIQECMAPDRQIRIAMASHFAFDRSELNSKDKASIDHMIDSIRGIHGQITIVGHTDTQGSQQYNMALSLRRAQSVEMYMKSQLEQANYEWQVSHYGKSKPINAGVTRRDHQQNRRTYVVFEQTQPSRRSQPACQPIQPERHVVVAITSHFDFDRAELTNTSIVSLQEFIDNVANKKGQILVAGYTDLQGSVEYNEALALRRSESVKQYLQRYLPVEDYSWELKSFGERSPISEESSSNANALNRRAVVIFKEGIGE